MKPVKKIKQLNDYYCGPAALESFLDFFGVKKDQNELARLCETSPGEGTGNENLVSCLDSLGFNAQEHSPATWEGMKEYIERTDEPVIVGWYSDREEPGDEHYSVAYQMTNEEITMMDPEFGDELKVPRAKFMEAWRKTEPINWFLTAVKR